MISLSIRLFMFVFLFVSLTECKEEKQSIKLLIPDVLLGNEEIVPEIEVRKYQLANLQPNTQYEVRISYPAYYPTQFFISFVTSNRHSPHTRSLLNIEKITFRTDTSSHILGQEVPENCYEIEVRAEHRGVTPQPVLKRRKVPYSISTLPIVVYNNRKVNVHNIYEFELSIRNNVCWTSVECLSIGRSFCLDHSLLFVDDMSLQTKTQLTLQ